MRFSRNRTRSLIILFLIVCIIGATVGWHFFKPAPAEPTPAPLVTLGSVTLKNMPLTLSSLGNLVASQSTMLQSEQAGVVKALYFKNGEIVKTGDLLLQLNDETQRATYNKNKASLYEAEMQYQRYVALNKFDPTVLSKVQIDQVYAAYQEAKATLAESADALSQMQIRAPFNGVLGATNISIGAFLNSGTPVVAIVNPNDFEVSYAVPEADYDRVQLGQQVIVNTDAYPGKTFNAHVVYKGAFIDPNSRSFIVRARLESSDGLAEGMLVHIRHTLINSRTVLTVPTSSLVADISGFGVYQVQNGKVIETLVNTGEQMGNDTEILSGLKNGDEIIVEGAGKVQPGMIVRTNNS